MREQEQEVYKKECEQCGKPFEAQRNTAKFCSDSCRVAASRVTVTDSAKDSVTKMEDVTLRDTVTLTEDVTLKPGVEEKIVKPNGLKEMEAKELYEAIENYQEDSWKDSPEYGELGKRLERMSVKELEAGGYFVPNWKKKGIKYPIR